MEIVFKCKVAFSTDPTGNPKLDNAYKELCKNLGFALDQFVSDSSMKIIELNLSDINYKDKGFYEGEFLSKN